MKFNLPKPKTVNVVVNVSVVLFVLLILFSFLPFMVESGSKTMQIGSTGSESYSVESSLVSIDPLISDTIPHRRYLRLADSLRQRQMMRNGVFSGSSNQTIFIGGLTLARCENCSMFAADNIKILEHFIKLNWWVLDTIGSVNPVRYYVKDGKAYLRKLVCKLNYSRDDHSDYKCREVDIAVPFRYDTGWVKGLLIPVSKRTVNILNGLCLCFAVFFLWFFLYYVVGGFVKFLLEIGGGTPFSDANVLRLKIIALSFLLIPVSIFLLNLLMRVIFHKYFTADIKLSVDAWTFLCKGLALSVIFGALYFAFRKGKELKEEQDLTV